EFERLAPIAGLTRRSGCPYAPKISSGAQVAGIELSGDQLIAFDNLSRSNKKWRRGNFDAIIRRYARLRLLPSQRNGGRAVSIHIYFFEIVRLKRLRHVQ